MEEKSNTKKIVGAIVGLLLLLVLAILLLSQGDTYEVKFDSVGGSKVSTQKVKSGEKAKRPKDPTKDGYEFVLWENDGVRYDFNKKVTEDLNLKATWKEEIKKYKITFELEGKEETFELEKLDEDVTSYLKFEDRVGYEIRWYVGDTEYDFTTPLTEDVKLTGKYVQTSSYTITFDTAGGNKIDSQKVGVGEKAKEPKEPTKKGFLFDGWYYNNAKFDFDSVVKRSMKLVAHWKEDPNVKRFKVTFDTDGGNAIKEQTIMDGDKATKPTNPTKKGFVFVDWMLNDTVYNFSRTVTANIELKAKWREAEIYKVTFDADNGTTNTVQEVQEGGKAKAPTNPVKEKSIFIEWRLDNKKYDFNKVVTKDITLKAYYEKEVYYTLTYNPNGGTVTPTSKELKKLDKYGTLPTPTYTGYTFIGWYTSANGGTAVNSGTTINGNTTIYAHWTKNPVAVSGVRLNKTSTSIAEGGSETLSVTISPSDASNKTITWSSSNTNVATVDGNGRVSAKKVGTATITATSNNNIKASCTVTVTASVTGVSLNKTSITLTAGGSEILTATVTPSNATNKGVTWSSSNTSVATVDNNGKVTAKAGGTATITVKTNDGNKTATCKVTVNVAVTGVSLNKTSLTLTVGGSETLTKTVTPSDATNKGVTWSSSNTSVATVDNNGKVTAKATGTATITVKTNDGNKTATCSVTVKAAPPSYRIEAVKLESGDASAASDRNLVVYANNNPISFKSIYFIDDDSAPACTRRNDQCIIYGGDISDGETMRIVLNDGSSVNAKVTKN